MKKDEMLFKALLKRFGKTLWEGSAQSGTITVEGSSKYIAFMIVMNNNPLIALRNDNSVFAFGVAGSLTSYIQYSKVFSANLNGDSWEIRVSKELSHNGSGNHGAGTAYTITKIVGLIPEMGGVVNKLLNLLTPERGWAL